MDDIESRVSNSLDVHSLETSPTLELKGEEPSSSRCMSGRKPRRKASTLRPVKSRIVDAVLRNVRDESSNVLKPVVITHNPSLYVACSVNVEVFPGPTPVSRTSINSALKVLKSSGERVVKFVRTPNLLLDAESLQTNRVLRNAHSIEDIIQLFPSPPPHAPTESAHFANVNYGPGSDPKKLAELPPALHSAGAEGLLSSLSTSATLLSVMSDDTAATSPPTTPELVRVMSTSNSVIDTAVAFTFRAQFCRPSLVRSPVENGLPVCDVNALSSQTNRKEEQDQFWAFDSSCCSRATAAAVHLSAENECTKLDDSDIVTPQGSYTTSRNPEICPTAITHADQESIQKELSNFYMPESGWRRLVKQDLRSVFNRDTYFSRPTSTFAVLRNIKTSTPSSSTGGTPAGSSCACFSAEIIRNGVGGTSRTATCSEDLAKTDAWHLPDH